MLNMDEEKKYKLITVGEGAEAEWLSIVGAVADGDISIRGLTELQSCATHRLYGRRSLSLAVVFSCLTSFSL